MAAPAFNPRASSSPPPGAGRWPAASAASRLRLSRRSSSRRPTTPKSFRCLRTCQRRMLRPVSRTHSSADERRQLVAAQRVCRCLLIEYQCEVRGRPTRPGARARSALTNSPRLPDFPRSGSLLVGARPPAAALSGPPGPRNEFGQSAPGITPG